MSNCFSKDRFQAMVQDVPPFHKVRRPTGADHRRGREGGQLMTYLDNAPCLQPQDIDYFKDLLSSQLDELLARAERTVAELIRNGDLSADIIDQASSDIGRNYTLRICDRESRLIGKIKIALSKIDDGTFGVCEACDEEIGVERLRARPVTAYCIRCKTKMEAFEKVSGI
jgi:DnaK suppressor protein